MPLRAGPAEIMAKRLVGFELRPQGLYPRLQARRRPAALPDLAHHTAEKVHAGGAPRDQADAEVAQDRDNLQFDGAGGQIVEALFGGEAKHVARIGGHLRGGDVIW